MPHLDAVETHINELQIGMFIASLDKPWHETPFIPGGFHVTSVDDISRIGAHCQRVFVDYYRSRLDAPPLRRKPIFSTLEVVHDAPAPVRKETTPAKFRVGGVDVVSTFFGHRKLNAYEDLTTLQQELPRARGATTDLCRAMSELLDGAAAGGRLDLVAVRQAVNPMVESVLRNPDACVWIALGLEEDGYTSRNSVGAAIWGAAFARHLGLPPVDAQRIALGALLLDIGKLRLPRDLLRKREPLALADFHQIKTHVRHGVEMLNDCGSVPRAVVEMVEFHHELYGGFGYAQGLVGDAIPIYGRIAAIIDCYDAITSHRIYSPALSPAQAVKKLYDARDSDFQAELVDVFVQAVGLYPAGTIVELSDGSVGVVVAGYRTRRLRPQVLLLLDRAKRPLSDPRELDLKSVTQDEDGKPLSIARALETGAYGIQSGDIML